MRTLLVALTGGLVFLLAACGEVDQDRGPAFETDYIGKVSVPSDTDVKLRQFSFTDLDGVRQKCFLMGGHHGSVSCQPATPTPTPSGTE